MFVEAPERFQQNTTIPQAFYDQCSFWDMPSTGNVVGLNSTTDFRNQPLGPYPLVMVRSSSEALLKPELIGPYRAGPRRRSAHS